MDQTKYNDVLAYINAYWDQLLDSKAHEKRGWRNRFMRIGTVRLPHPALSPNTQYFASTQFYWDSYFTILGLVVSGSQYEARTAVDNLCYLHQKFGLFPARNSWTS